MKHMMPCDSSVVNEQGDIFLIEGLYTLITFHVWNKNSYFFFSLNKNNSPCLE
jgi:hypothetical protein